MLNVTDTAKKELISLLLRHMVSKEACIRIAVGTLGRFGLILSKPKTGDEIVQDQGERVLLVGNEFKDILNGAKFDVEYNGNGREFVMKKR